MNSEHVLAKLRQYLLIISAGIFVMTVTELFFLSHWNETIQFLPFALSGLGLATLAFAYFRPSRGVLTTLRWSMLIIAVCSLIGFYEHMVTITVSGWRSNRMLLPGNWLKRPWKARTPYSLQASSC